LGCRDASSSCHLLPTASVATSATATQPDANGTPLSLSSIVLSRRDSNIAEANDSDLIVVISTRTLILMKRRNICLRGSATQPVFRGSLLFMNFNRTLQLHFSGWKIEIGLVKMLLCLLRLILGLEEHPLECRREVSAADAYGEGNAAECGDAHGQVASSSPLVAGS